MKNEHSIQGEMASSKLLTQIRESKQLYIKGIRKWQFLWVFARPLFPLMLVFGLSAFFFIFSSSISLALLQFTITFCFDSQPTFGLNSVREKKWLLMNNLVCTQCWWYTYIDLIVVISYYIALTSSTRRILFFRLPVVAVGAREHRDRI